MPVDDPDELEEQFLDMIEGFEVEKAISDQRMLRKMEAMVSRAKELKEARARRQDEERRIANWLEAMNVNHTILFEAINETLHETNELARSSQERLREIERNMTVRGHSAFTASQDILDEGEYLWRVLATGVQGTESPGQLLKDGTSEYIEPAVKVLADAIEKGEW